MDDKAIEEMAKQLGVGANYLAEHLTDFAPQWGMMKAIQSSVGVIITAVVLAVLLSALRKAMKAEGDEVWGYDKFITVVVFLVFALTALIILGSFAADAAMHLAVPQAAMINDMLEMVQR